MKFSSSLSKKYAKLINAKKKQCYSNSALVVIALMDENPILCEGLAVPQTIAMPFEHAWVEYKGNIIDVTWTEGAAVYHPINKHDAETTYRHANAGGVFPIDRRVYGNLNAEEIMELFKKLIDLANK